MSGPTMKMLGASEVDSDMQPENDAEATEQEATATKAKVTTKKKTKIKIKTSVTPSGVDLIETTVAEVENLTKTAARKMGSELIDLEGFNAFRMGGVFSKISDEGWFGDFGYEKFSDFVEGEYGIQYRKAQYLIGIYTDLVNSEVEWEQVKDVGWTKLKEIAKVINPQNVEEWVERAKEMTTLQLIEFIKHMNSTGEESPKSDVTTITFKLHADQKQDVKAGLEQAMIQFGTEYEAVALHHLVMAYVGGDLGKASVKTIDVVKAAGKDATLAALKSAFGYDPAAGTDEGLLATIQSNNPIEILNAFEQAYPDITLAVDVPQEAIEKYGIVLDNEEAA